MERTGWLFQFDGVSNLNHHPVCATEVAARLSSLWRSHPSWPGGAIAHLKLSARYEIERHILTPGCASSTRRRYSHTDAMVPQSGGMSRDLAVRRDRTVFESPFE